MPELPEVETVRRGLVPALEGRRLTSARAYRPDLRLPLPERFAERLEGREVQRLRRRSKYILADLDGDETWIIHLGMSGRLLLTPSADAPAERGPHDHVVVETEAARVVYNDARRFGLMDLCRTDALETHRLLARIGPEPLSNGFSAAYLADRLRGRATPIKAALLDQTIVAGLGNIYVAEALWRARLRPTRLAGALSRGSIERLAPAIRQVLEDAIEAGGSSLKDYRQADGELGYFQHSFRVYDREGAPCPREGCRGRVRRIVQSGRSSFYCAACQR